MSGGSIYRLVGLCSCTGVPLIMASVHALARLWHSLMKHATTMVTHARFRHRLAMLGFLPFGARDAVGMMHISWWPPPKLGSRRDWPGSLAWVSVHRMAVLST